MNVLQFIIDIAAKGDQAVLKKIGAIQQKMGGAEAAAERLANATGGRLRQAFMSLPGASFFTNPIVALSSGIGVVAKLGMETEKTATAFGVLAGSEDRADKVLNQLNEYADKAGWGRTEIVSAAQAMMGYGASAESAHHVLMMLGDVAMGDKNKLQSLSLAYGQVIGAGRLTGQELLQLVNAGFNPLLEISEMTGKSIAQLKKDMGDGKISVEMVRKAFEKATGPGGRFEGMMAKIANTSAGAFNQMKSGVNRGLLRLYDIIQPLLIPAFQKMGNVLDRVFGVLEKVLGFLVKYGQWLLPAVAAVAAFTVTANAATTALRGWLAVQKILNVVMMQNPVGWVVTGVAALVAVITVCYNKFAGFRAVVLTVWDVLKEFANGIKDFVLGRLEKMLGMLNAVGEVIAKIFGKPWEAVKTGVGNAVSSLGERMKGTRIGRRYQEHLAEQTKKELSDPKGSAGTDKTTGLSGLDTGSLSPSTVANDITTGGTRNTSITLNIGKFWEDVNVFQAEDMDMNTLSRKVLEAINRSLEAATSAAR